VSNEHERRPAPRYGEYAETDTQQNAGNAADELVKTNSTQSTGEPTPPSQPDAVAHRQASAVTTGAPAPQPVSSGQLPGVPHNLGVSGGVGAATTVTPTVPPAQSPQAHPTAPQSPNQPSSSAGQQPVPHGEPYRATQAPGAEANPTGSSAPHYAAAPAPAAQSAQAGTAPKRGADRIISILLLALGAIGALNLGLSSMQMPSQMALGAEMFGLSDFVVPSSVSTIGTVGAIIILSLFAVTLIYSIQRLRARKLTFWVPLTAGVISFIVMLALTLIAFSQAPELLQAMAQPEATQQMFAYIEAQGL
jgi:NADH:ubiquinone oxidoreductase subunit 6 (subunit J)